MKMIWWYAVYANANSSSSFRWLLRASSWAYCYAIVTYMFVANKWMSHWRHCITRHMRVPQRLAWHVNNWPNNSKVVLCLTRPKPRDCCARFNRGDQALLEGWEYRHCCRNLYIRFQWEVVNYIRHLSALECCDIMRALYQRLLCFMLNGCACSMYMKVRLKNIVIFVNSLNSTEWRRIRLFLVLSCWRTASGMIYCFRCPTYSGFYTGIWK